MALARIPLLNQLMCKASDSHMSIWFGANLKDKRFVFPLLVLFLGGTEAAQTQVKPALQSSANRQAVAKFEEGQAALKIKDYDVAFTALREAIELYPEYAAAHEAFMDAFGRFPSAGVHYQEKLVETYSAWAARYPKSAYIQYSLGQIAQFGVRTTVESGETFFSPDLAKANNHYLKAVELDPKFKLAYRGLAYVAWVRNDREKRRDYLMKILEIDPTDVDAAVTYVTLFRYSDPATFEKLAGEVINRNPKDARIEELLSMMADDAGNSSKRITILEQIYSVFAGTTEDYWFPSSMRALFDAYARDEPEKALAFATEMLKAYPNSLVVSAETVEQNWRNQNWVVSLHYQAHHQILMHQYWTEVAEYQGALVQAATLLKRKNAGEALALLDKAKPPQWGDTVDIDTSRLDLLKAEALSAASDTGKGYDYLLNKVAALPFNAALHRALLDSAVKLSKTSRDVDEEIWQLRTAAPVLKDFELTTYDGKKVKLSDYRGRPVLVNFWFPSCGYCRMEFPYFNNLAKKYADRGLAILTININYTEDNLVPSIMKEYPLFVTLRVPRLSGELNEWSRTNYDINGGPFNFLLDAEGRIMFKPRVRNLESQHVMEAEIEELLSRASMKNAVRKSQVQP